VADRITDEELDYITSRQDLAIECAMRPNWAADVLLVLVDEVRRRRSVDRAVDEVLGGYDDTFGGDL
jgi:hypothetical protein